VAPSVLALSLVQGESAATEITVGNAGPHPLVFSAEIVPSPLPGVSAETTWLEVSPASGVVPAGESAQLTAQINAAALGVGAHGASILIHSNDPDEPTVAVPVSLDVLGRPELVAAPQSLEFGPVYIGYPEALALTLTNAGSGTVEVYDIRSDHPDFSPGETGFSLGVGESRDVAIQFAPGETGQATATLAIESNDYDGIELLVPLMGTGLVAPELAVSPESVTEELFVGYSSTRVVRLDNPGGSDLAWEAEPKGVGAGGTLEQVLSELDEHHETVTSLIPLRHDFAGGADGFSIADGGLDMFDNGNFLETYL
jgi:hypothetical protein